METVLPAMSLSIATASGSMKNWAMGISTPISVAMYSAYAALFFSKIVAVLSRTSMRCAALVLDQLVKAVSADSTAFNASSAVAEDARQHGALEAGLMTSKVEERGSSLPPSQRGIVRSAVLLVEGDSMVDV